MNKQAINSKHFKHFCFSPSTEIIENVNEEGVTKYHRVSGT